MKIAYVIGSIVNTVLLCQFGQVYVENARVEKAYKSIEESVSLDEKFEVNIADVLGKRPLHRSDSMYVKCLGANIYHEARGEDYEGMLNVAFVTMNRVKSKSWPDDVCSVVYQPYQFSWTISGKAEILDSVAYEVSEKIANDVFYGRIQDTSKGATHYFAHDKVNPKWAPSYDVVAILGNHTFLR